MTCQRQIKYFISGVWRGSILYITSLIFITGIEEIPALLATIWIGLSLYFFKVHMSGTMDDIQGIERVIASNENTT